MIAHRHHGIRAGRVGWGIGALVLLAMMASCLPVPLGDADKSQVDAKLTGFWQDANDATSGSVVAIAPADSHVYVIDDVEYKMTGDKPTLNDHMVLRGWLTDIKGTRFLTTEILVQAASATPQKGKVYPTFKIVLKGDTLEATMLDEKFDGFKDVKDPAALAKVIEQNLDNPKMYGASATIFQRLDADKEQNKPLIDLFGKALPP